MTEKFQQQIRNCPLWQQRVDELGEEEAHRLLKQCKADIKQGLDREQGIVREEVSEDRAQIGNRPRSGRRGSPGPR